MIQFSQAAIRELKRLQSKTSHGSEWVRIAVVEGGCAGLLYDLQFGHTRQPGDQHFTVDTVQVLVSAEALSRCDGMTIDYSEDLMGGNFRFANPLARQTCGCGVSFSLDASPLEPAEDCQDASL
ncbi:MAG: iron-sulfur cluster assembly accessory protein [Leptolyngbyaceae cyanobacterium T60_A2020_046]|nr:iron-sulfur cluster assembly accessory protein [Leptolyngbyaceae cyanobacterium T60_A2020_046]